MLQRHTSRFSLLRNPIAIRPRLVQLAPAHILLLGMLGCAVPRAELAAYARSFAAARTVAEDVMLEARAAAERWAIDPRNKADVPARLDRLQQTRDAVEARLAALEVVGNFNALLESLASAADSTAVQGELQKLHEGLKVFNARFLSRFAEAIPQYGPILAEAISVIDNLIRAAQFRAAVKKGEAAVLAIATILQSDAETMHQIFKDRIELEQMAPKAEAALLQQPFRSAVLAYKASALVRTDAEIQNRAMRFESALKALRPASAPPFELPAPDASSVAELQPTERVQLMTSLSALVADAEGASGRYIALEEEVKAHRKLTDEYKSTLKQLAEAMKQLREALDKERVQAVVDVAAQVLRLRQAVLELRKKERS